VVVFDKIGPGVAGGVKYVIEGIRCKLIYQLSTDFNKIIFGGVIKTGCSKN